MSGRKSRALVAAAGAVVGVCSSFGAAATSINTWNGGGTDSFWLTAANWTAGVAPAAGDSLVFAGSVRTTPGNNFAAGTPFGGIIFHASAASFTLGGNALTLPSTAGLINNSTNLQTISLPITLAFGDHSINGGTAGLALTGSITRNTAATARFSGSVTGAALTNDASGILGAWATIGTDYAAINAAHVVPYSGYLELASNPATIPSAPGRNIRWTQGDPGNPGTSTGTTTLAAGVTDINTLDYPVNNTGTILFTANSTLRFGATGGVYKAATPSGLLLSFGAFGSDGVGTITAGGSDNAAGEIVLNCAASQIFVYPRIADNGSGALRVVSTTPGGGNISFQSSNSYTGGTYIAGGLLRTNDISGAGFGSGSVQVASGAQAYLDAISPANTFPGATYPNDFYVDGTGTDGSAGVFQGALRLGRTGIVVSGSVHLLSDVRITFHGAGTTPGAQITGKITGNYALMLGGGNAVSTLTLTNANNDWIGNTSIDFGILKIGGAGEVIPNGSGKGNVIFTASIGTLDLNGKTETINALIDNNDDLDIHRVISSAPGGKLIVGDNNASGAFGGFSSRLSDGGGQLSITKIGTGQQVLIGNNNYTGTTTVQGGRLVLVNNGDSSAWTPVFNNGGADIKGGRLALNYNGSTSPRDQVQSILAIGYTQPTKFSSGQLRISNPADPAKGLGWKDDLANTEVVVGYTYFGDANLDGTVNTVDFTTLASHFNSTSENWELGDFNYDGNVNALDFNAIASNFGKVSLPAPIALGTLVPEPGTAALAAGCCVCFRLRRRRQLI
jgi:autotransporter-associated beta strand protein